MFNLFSNSYKEGQRVTLNGVNGTVTSLGLLTAGVALDNGKFGILPLNASNSQVGGAFKGTNTALKAPPENAINRAKAIAAGGAAPLSLAGGIAPLSLTERPSTLPPAGGATTGTSDIEPDTIVTIDGNILTGDWRNSEIHYEGQAKIIKKLNSDWYEVEINGKLADVLRIYIKSSSPSSPEPAPSPGGTTIPPTPLPTLCTHTYSVGEKVMISGKIRLENPFEDKVVASQSAVITKLLPRHQAGCFYKVRLIDGPLDNRIAVEITDTHITPILGGPPPPPPGDSVCGIPLDIRPSRPSGCNFNLTDRPNPGDTIIPSLPRPSPDSVNILESLSFRPSRG